ncbi:hypothetical protein Trydic_g3803 [Trypoxylus dichotomus]
MSGHANWKERLRPLASSFGVFLLWMLAHRAVANPSPSPEPSPSPSPSPRYHANYENTLPPVQPGGPFYKFRSSKIRRNKKAVNCLRYANITHDRQTCDAAVVIFASLIEQRTRGVTDRNHLHLGGFPTPSSLEQRPPAAARRFFARIFRTYRAFETDTDPCRDLE